MAAMSLSFYSLRNEWKTRIFDFALCNLRTFIADFCTSYYNSKMICRRLFTTRNHWFSDLKYIEFINITCFYGNIKASSKILHYYYYYCQWWLWTPPGWS
jgi:hypothetical protein